MPPKVTVLMPIYRDKDFLPDAIGSILNQTLEDFEFLIIIEYGTSDETIALVNSYQDKRIILVKNEHKLGIAQSLNRGLDLAQGEYIARMDSDDISYPKRLEKQVKFMESNPQVGICGTWARAIGIVNNIIKVPLDCDSIKVALLFQCILIHPTVMFRRHTLNQYNLRYNPELLAAEDYDLWCRAIQYLQIANIGEVLLDYRVHGANATKINEKNTFAVHQQINKKQLQKFGIEATQEELDRHFRIAMLRYENISLADEISMIDKWFSRLRSANAKVLLYDKKKLDFFLTKKWGECYRKYRNFICLKLFLRYASSNLANFKCSIIFALKFIFNYIAKQTYNLVLDKYEKAGVFFQGIKWKLVFFCNSLFSKTPAKVLQTQKIHKISFFMGCAEGESKRYRVYNIVDLLREKGIQTKVFSHCNINRLDALFDSDILIVFRARFDENLDLMLKQFREHKIPIVFDADDLIFEPESVNFIGAVQRFEGSDKEYLVRAYHLKETMFYRKALTSCDYATTTTDFLVERLKKIPMKAFVVKNGINDDQFVIAERFNRKKSFHNKVVKIGYFSGTNTHVKDFKEAVVAIYGVLDKYQNVEFHLVGNLTLDERFAKFGSRVVKKPYMHYLSMLKYLSQIDVNIAPLELNNPFTAGKSELKIFEAALVKVPTIASGVDSYAKCINHGVNGYIANNAQEWKQYLLELVESADLREKIALKAHDDFVKQFYMRNIIGDIISTYENIIINNYL